MGLSKNQIKEISALQQKKFRQRTGLFVVEGAKIAEEVLHKADRFNIETIVAVQSWIDTQKNITNYKQLYVTSEKDLERISGLKTANQVLLVLSQRKFPLPAHLHNKLSLVLDRIQDPGNLGTMIRIADWFGIEHIFCSKDTVDCYNPKVIQSTMGSFLRVKLHYLELETLFNNYPEIPRYGALLDGKNVFNEKLEKSAFLIIGNESKGLSKEAQGYVSHPIMIPRYGEAESLNAAIATGILCATFKK